MEADSPAMERVRSLSQDFVKAILPVDAALQSGAALDACYPAVQQAFDRLVAGLRALGLEGPANRLPSSELWKIAGDLLCRGWLQMQARTKPRGYAGDYHMLARIYENRLCEDPLGNLFDRYFQEEAAPRAVRNRMAMMREWIIGAASGLHYPKIAVVGSAFGLEVRDALLSLSNQACGQVSVTLFDVDPDALEFARQQLAPLVAAERLTTVSGNLFRLPSREKLAAPLANTDLLLCPGLFDYLSDDEAAAMLALFRACLSPAGQAHIFQFAPHNPTRTYMEWLGNWYLLYRTDADLVRLADAAGIPRTCLAVGSEPLGVDLLLTLKAK